MFINPVILSYDLIAVSRVFSEGSLKHKNTEITEKD